EAKITVVSEDGKAQSMYTIKFTQEDAYLNSVVLGTEKTTLNEDDLATLSLEATLISGEKLNNSDLAIEYLISDKFVLSMIDGKLGAVGEGTAEVFASVTYKGKTVASNTLTITVNKSDVNKIIVSLKPENITTAIGVKPVLPEVVTAEYNVGLPKLKAVTWEDIKAENYQGAGRFTVYGDVEGTSIKAMAQVEVKGEVGISNISTVTLVNEEPVLPGEVTVYYSDNSEAKMPVAWDEISEEAYAEVGTFTVSGTVEGSNLKATATVRVSDEAVEGLNITRFQNGYDYPRTAASYSNEPPADPASKDRLAHLNNDIISFTDSPHDRWTNWKRTPDTTGWVSVEFGRTGPQEYYYDEMIVNYFTDSGVSLPASAKVQYKKDGAWVDVTNQTVRNGENANTKIYSFDKVKSSEVRLFMNAQSGKSLGITELQIFKDDVVKSSNSKLSEIKLDGKALEGFNGDTFKYNVDLEGDRVPVITAKAEDNAAVTVIPPTGENKKARIIVTAEDGIATNTYEIDFAKTEVVNKAELGEKLEEAREAAAGNYTVETLKVLEDAILYAETVNSNEKATQYNVDSAVSLLNDAIAQLVEIEKPEEKPSADLNKDGKVDIGDLSIASKYYGQNKPEYDLNKDGIIDNYEINFIASKILE
ncbi:Ig-like domain-containing protein, partial [Clostridium sp.]|uniref:Ig-like domain-containing protein n=1 Tax=Clostridium sp. TaxID=1506 RepID=UPI003F3422DA